MSDPVRAPDEQVQSARDVFARMQQLFAEQQYAVALRLLDQYQPAFPNHRLDWLYLRSCLEVRLGRRAQALELLESIDAAGLWFGTTLMRESPSFAPLQGDPRFERLVEAFRATEHASDRDDGPVVVEPEHARGGTILALHGNGERAISAVEAWEPARAAGWALAALTSSQRAHAESEVWDDVETAVRDVALQSAKVPAALLKQPVVIGGFSLGADVALRAALLSRVDVRGVVMLGPTGRLADDPDSTQLLTDAPALRVAIVLGELDDGVDHGLVLRMVEAVRAAGMATSYVVVPGLNHSPPAADVLGDAVRFALLGA